MVPEIQMVEMSNFVVWVCDHFIDNSSPKVATVFSDLLLFDVSDHFPANFISFTQ